MNTSPLQTIRKILEKVLTLYLPIVLILSAISLYYGYLFIYNVNVPRDDDYGIALKSLIDFTSCDGLSCKLKILFSQHGEHRLFFPRLIVIIDHYLQGINFYTLVMIGNLGMLGILWVMFKADPNKQAKVLFFSPIVLLMLQLQHWENSTFPTASIQSFYVVLFSMLSLYSLTKDGRVWTIISILTFFLATFTSGSGMVCLVPGILILIIRRHYSRLISWLAFAILSVAGYFFHYHGGAQSKVFHLIIYEPVALITRFFVCAGSFINFTRGWETPNIGYPASIIAGAIITVLFLYLTVTRYFLKSPLLYSFLLLFLVMCAMLCVSRFDQYSMPELATISRYKIISTCLVAVCYLILLDLFKGRLIVGWAIAPIILAIAYNAYSYEKNLGIFKVNINAQIETSWSIFQNNDYSKVKDWDPAASAKVLQEAQAKDIYHMPDLRDEYIRRINVTNEQVELSWEQIADADSTVVHDFQIQHTKNNDTYAIIKGWALTKGKNTRGSLFTFKSKDKTYFYKMEINYRDDITALMHSKNQKDSASYNDCGFNVAIRSSNMANGLYEIGVVVQNWDGSSYFISDHKKVQLDN
jgi:hypothetical protein